MNSLRLSKSRRSTCSSSHQSCRSASSATGSSGGGTAKVSPTSSSSKKKENGGVAIGSGTNASAEDILRLGIASQKAGVENVIARGTGFGAIDRVPNVSNHGFSPWKMVGDKERNELSRAARLAITKLNKAISGNSEGARKLSLDRVTILSRRR